MQFDLALADALIELVLFTFIYSVDFIYATGLVNRFFKRRKKNKFFVTVINSSNVEELREIEVDSKRRMSNINIIKEREKSFSNFCKNTMFQPEC